MIALALVVLFIAACLSASVRRGLAYVAGLTVLLLCGVYFYADEQRAQQANARWYTTNCPSIVSNPSISPNHPTVKACLAFQRSN